jgi:predicted NBD/HSP70 family sugar kinase
MGVRWTEGTGRQASLRRQNLSRLLSEVHTGGRVSRSDLAVRMQVNRSTVASLVGELSERGFVGERAPGSRTAPGRPSPIVEPRRDGPAVLAMEIATDSLAAAVVGLGGTILDSVRVDHAGTWRDPGETVGWLVALAESLVERSSSGDAIVAAGVSIAGVVRREDGFVHVAPNLGWRDVPLSRLVGERLDLDGVVRVGNDADLATLAEHARGAGMGRSDFICLWGEAGMGAGIVVGGRQLNGSAGYAGEVGHMPVNPEGTVCHCGSRGCWETEVGEAALLRYAGLQASGGGRAALDTLFGAADRGDERAIAAMATVARWLGVGLAGLVNVFNPSGLALGGLYARLYPYVHEAIEQVVSARAIPAARGVVEIMPAALGPDSALLGAAELAFAPTIADPTLVPRVKRGARGRGRHESTSHQAVAQHQGGDVQAVRSM